MSTDNPYHGSASIDRAGATARARGSMYVTKHVSNQHKDLARDRPENKEGVTSMVTPEMVKRGCEVVHRMGGVPKNPYFGPDQFEVEVREVLEIALGLRELDQ